METLLVVPVFTIAVALFAVLILLHFVPMGLWISALAADVSISLFNLVGMRFRRVEPRMIVIPLIKGTKAGLGLNVNQLEAHYLAGGNVDNVVDALIAAHRAQIDLTFEQAAAIDLAGRNVLEAVQMSVNPKVIETPIVSAVAANGIELKIKARVTVRANIDRLVGGAGEPTIIARVGEGIVTTVGSSQSHTDVLANPDDISKTVLGKGLDAWFAHEFRRAGFNPDAVWPRASDPRVLPTDITALLQRVPADLREDLSARLLKLRAVAPQDASILGRAYTKQVDVVMSSWSTGPELLLSTKSQSSSFGKNLPNRFEEAYGDAGNLRARYPLAAVGFAFVLSSAIHAEPSQLERAIDMMRKLRDRGDGNGYTATCLLMYDASPSGAVSILTDAIPADLGAPQFIDTMITTILDAAPASSHRTVRDRRQGYLLLGE